MSLRIRSLDQLLEETLLTIYAQWYALPRRSTLPLLQELRAGLAAKLDSVVLPNDITAFEQALIDFARELLRLAGVADAGGATLADLAAASPPSTRQALSGGSLITKVMPAADRVQALAVLLRVEDPPLYAIAQMNYSTQTADSVWDSVWAVLEPRLKELPAGDRQSVDKVTQDLDQAKANAATYLDTLVAYKNALLAVEKIPGVVRVAWRIFLSRKFVGPAPEFLQAAIRPAEESYAAAGAEPPPPSPPSTAKDIAEPTKRVEFFADIRFPAKVKQREVQWLTVQLTLEAAAESVTTEHVPVVFTQPDPNELPPPEFVEVRLMAPGFSEATGVWERTITVYPNRDSQPAVFLLSSDVLGRKRVTVDFYHKGRMISSIAFASEVTDSSTAVVTAPVATEGTLDLAEILSAPPPPVDLELRVALAAEQNRLEFMLNSARADIPFHNQPMGSIQLTEKDPQAFFAHRLERLSQLAAYGDSDAGKARVQQEIEALGEGLFELLIPAELQQAYWDTIQGLQKSGAVKTLLINSDEPWIPWELIKPYRWNDATDTDEVDNFLVETFVLSRWLAGRGPAAEIDVKQATLIMPELDLTYVQEERAYFDTLKSKQGLQINGPLQRRAAVLDLFRTNSDYQVLHFATHGSFNADNADLSELSLADGNLVPDDLLGRDLSGIRKAKPLVFLNACHSGQAALGLTGIGGWAEKLFREAKASAFIGTLWEVSDDLAAEFSKLFYSSLAQGQTLGEALRTARLGVHKDQPENPTWLAYALYGDPNATVKFG